MQFKLTKKEKSWIFYDVGNSAFVLMVSTILPVYFNYLAQNAGVSDVDYLAYWGYAAFFLQVSTGSVDNIKPELVLQDFYQYFGKKYYPFNMQIHRVETYEHTENGLRPLYQAGDVIEA